MIPNVLLIQTPSIDFSTFLGVSRQALDYSPSEIIDASPVERSEAERFLACLAALKDRNATGIAQVLVHVTFSVLVAADDRDMLDILQIAAGMPFVVTDTMVRGVQLAVITGNLAQWRDAVKVGCTRDSEFNIRACFNRLMDAFKAVGLDVWKECESHSLPDRTLYLTYKR